MSAGALVRRAAIRTLGCRVNEYESGEIARQLRGLDYRVVAAAEDADLIVVNTCAVTLEAERQARQEIRRLVRANPNARVVVTGCYAESNGTGVRAIEGVHTVVGNRGKLDVAGWLGALPVIARTDDAKDSSRAARDRPARTRAIVQIQQGCDHDCTFCIVHTLRGPSRSRPPAEVIAEARALVESGCREIVLSGVDLGSYGDGRLAELLDELCALPGDFRVRLSSLDPMHLDDELIARFARHERLCPHLHLSLQSGNELVLKRMKRRCPAALARERVARVRGVRPDLLLSADLMVGFPTEGEAHFEDTALMVGELEIAFAHVFAYSPRPGTPAARIPAARQVTPEEKSARAARLRTIAASILDASLKRRVGRRARVLVEKNAATSEGMYRARAADYLAVWVPSTECERGQFAEVRYTGVKNQALIGRVTV